MLVFGVIDAGNDEDSLQSVSGCPGIMPNFPKCMWVTLGANGLVLQSEIVSLLGFSVAYALGVLVLTLAVGFQNWAREEMGGVRGCNLCSKALCSACGQCCHLRVCVRACVCVCVCV